MNTVKLCFLVALAVSSPIRALSATEIPQNISADVVDAKLHCPDQKMEGEVTATGLWLSSMPGNIRDGSFRLEATALGRTGCTNIPTTLCPTGQVVVSGSQVRWERSLVSEEYSAGLDGVRQDFAIEHPPVGRGGLDLELALSGARALPASYGATIIPRGSSRVLTYSRLRATDANGHELAARMEVVSDDRLQVQLDDTDAVYPVRIDPTFSDADWVNLGTLNGANGTVFAMTENDSAGLFYVGGAFTAIGSTVASGVAVWNGTNWQSLGAGLNGTVRALALDDSGNLYAAGIFTNSSLQITNVAEWNGTAWSSLGAGLNGLLLAITVDPSGNVYVGGNFTNNSISAMNIAEWNGTSWSAMGTGMNSYVSALTVDSSGNVYAGGNFTVVNGSSMPYIAEWTGGAWVPLDSGMSGPVSALTMSYGVILVAGGAFITAGGYTVNRIAEWYGGWDPLPSSPGIGMNGPVNSLAATDAGIYAGGIFTAAGGIGATNVAFWNGNSWSALPGGPGYFVYSVGVDAAGTFHVGGNFGIAGGLPVAIANWNGSAWTTIPANGLNNTAYTLAVDNAGNLYAGGLFNQAGGIAVSNVAKWNGTSWVPLGSGMYPPPQNTLSVNSLTTDPAGNLYAGGAFTYAGGIVASNIAEWNGTNWLALGSGISGPYNEANVNAVVSDGKGNLYAGGNFTSAGGVAAANIAKWNGTNWSPLGGGLNNFVFDMAMDKWGNLYVGGDFTQAGSAAANGIAEWNGTNWLALSSGVGSGGLVNGLVPDNAGNLYVAGEFTSAGGVAATNVAVWSGTNWSALGAGLSGSGFNNEVFNLALDADHNLYAGGPFTSSGSMVIKYLAKWDGATWSTLGSSVNGPATSLKADSAGRLYISGYFSIAGTNVSAFVAQANVLPLISGQQYNLDGSYSFNFLSTPNSTNRVFAANSLLSGNWQPIRTNVAPVNGFLQFTDSAAAQHPSRFYRFTSP